jgi:hypothetical protein
MIESGDILFRMSPVELVLFARLGGELPAELRGKVAHGWRELGKPRPPRRELELRREIMAQQDQALRRCSAFGPGRFSKVIA